MSIKFEGQARFFLLCLSGLDMILMQKAVYYGLQRSLVKGWEGEIPVSEKRGCLCRGIEGKDGSVECTGRSSLCKRPIRQRMRQE